MINRGRDLLRLRVELKDILPPIWREILVPARYSFWDLHVAIQDAMGWWDYHLHEFRPRDRERRKQVLIGMPSEEDFADTREVLPGWEIPVTAYLCEPGDRVEYEYDFGDSWRHEITLQSIAPRIKGQRYPRCTAGARACPPEDCGGVPGYQSLLEALLDPKHPEHQTLSDWIPSGWGPGVFRPEDVRFDNPTRRWKRAFLEEP